MFRHRWRHQQVGRQHGVYLVSDAAYNNIKHSYEDVLEQLAEPLTDWDEREHATRSSDDKESRPATNP